MKRRIVVITLILCTLLQALAFTASAATVTKDYEVTASSGVMEDLSHMLFEGEAFRETDYPLDTTDDTFRVIRFLETGFNGTTFDDDAAIYVYVYNPSAQYIVKDSDQNRLTLKVGTGYQKYDLTYCNSNGDNRFLKYRVDIDVDTLRENFSGTTRTYEVSEIELYQSGLNATAFKVGGEYIYTGSGEDLYCATKDFFTIELEITGTYYRPDVMSSGGADHRNELASVYFSVPNSVLKNYEKLYSVQGEYYENEIASIVTENEEYYNLMQSLQGSLVTDFEGYDASADAQYSSQYPSIYAGYSIVTSSVANCTYGLNASRYPYGKSLTVAILNRLKNIPYIFHSKTVEFDETIVTSELLKKRVEKYGLITLTGSPNTVKTPYDISPKDGYTLKSYASTHSDFETFIAQLRSWWKQDVSSDVIIESALVPVDYSEISQMKTERASDYYFVNENDISDLKLQCAKAKATDKTVYLLRFAQSEVATYEADIVANDSGITVDDDQKTYLFTQTYYKDFDVLSLTFQDERGEFVMVPVVSSPTDVVGDIVLTDDFPALSDLTEDWWKWLIALLLILLLAIVLILVFQPFLNTALQDLSRSMSRGWQKLKSSLTPKKRQKKRTRQRKYSRRYRK